MSHPFSFLSRLEPSTPTTKTLAFLFFSGVNRFSGFQNFFPMGLAPAGSSLALDPLPRWLRACCCSLS